MTQPPSPTPVALAAVALVSLALCTAILRGESGADAYRLAAARAEVQRLERRLGWLEAELGARVADPALLVTEDDVAAPAAEERP